MYLRVLQRLHPCVSQVVEAQRASRPVRVHCKHFLLSHTPQRNNRRSDEEVVQHTVCAYKHVDRLWGLCSGFRCHPSKEELVCMRKNGRCIAGYESPDDSVSRQQTLWRRVSIHIYGVYVGLRFVSSQLFLLVLSAREGADSGVDGETGEKLPRWGLGRVFAERRCDVARPGSDSAALPRA
jgi:hypothetical protein